MQAHPPTCFLALTFLLMNLVAVHMGTSLYLSPLAQCALRSGGCTTHTPAIFVKLSALDAVLVHGSNRLDL